MINQKVRSVFLEAIRNSAIKAELLQEGILFGTQFPSLASDFYLSKKVGFHKN